MNAVGKVNTMEKSTKGSNKKKSKNKRNQQQSSAEEQNCSSINSVENCKNHEENQKKIANDDNGTVLNGDTTLNSISEKLNNSLHIKENGCIEDFSSSKHYHHHHHENATKYNNDSQLKNGRATSPSPPASSSSLSTQKQQQQHNKPQTKKNSNNTNKSSSSSLSSLSSTQQSSSPKKSAKVVLESQQQQQQQHKSHKKDGKKINSDPNLDEINSNTSSITRLTATPAITIKKHKKSKNKTSQQSTIASSISSTNCNQNSNENSSDTVSVVSSTSSSSSSSDKKSDLVDQKKFSNDDDDDDGNCINAIEEFKIEENGLTSHSKDDKEENDKYEITVNDSSNNEIKVNSSSSNNDNKNRINDDSSTISSSNCLSEKVDAKIDSQSQDECKKQEINNLPKEIDSSSSSSSSAAAVAATAVAQSSSSSTESTFDHSNIIIEYKEYESELQMQDIMRLIQTELSEPYSIYTYRYFIYNWPKLCFLAAHGNEYVGAIVCKLDMHMNVKRGYIAMLAVKKEYRKLRIGTNLVQKAIEAMLADNADEVVLETEMKNIPALRLYENLGFVRDKRLFRYYLNGVDALRLKLWFR